MGNLQAMAESIPWHGQDGKDLNCIGYLGMGVLQTFTTPESCHERPIPRDTRRNTILAGNFRVDNRDELIQKLELTNRAIEFITDADLILAAYAKWENQCARQLLGDFAFALWDGTKKQLLLVRDQIGIAPLYYFPTSWGLLFSSDLRALAAHPDGPKTLDPAAIIHHLRDAQYILPGSTYLARVRKLLPGHQLKVTQYGSHLQRYWSPTGFKTIRLPSPEAYARRLRELFEEAIACRLRSIHPIGTHLSGGLDSTSIALEAQRQLMQSAKSLGGAFTWLPNTDPATARKAPEYRATRHAEDALGISAESIDLTPQALRRELKRNIALDGFADLWYETLIREKARERGIRSLLSGWGGDEIVSSGINGYPAELFWKGHWIKLARLIRSRIAIPLEPSLQTQKKPAWRRSLGFIYGHIFLPSLPNALYRRLPGKTLPPMPGFEAMAAPCGDILTRFPPAPDYQKRVGKHREMARSLMAGHTQARIEAWSAQGAQDGIQYVYPLLDRRLVEFCLAVPPDLFAERDTTRSLFRNAMRGLLPDDIRMASVKIESARVSRLIKSLSLAVSDPTSEEPSQLDLGVSLPRSRQIQVATLRTVFGADKTPTRSVPKCGIG